MNLVTFVLLRKTSLNFWTYGPVRMSEGMAGGEKGLGIGDGGGGVSGGSQENFRRGGVEGGVRCPGHPPVENEN